MRVASIYGTFVFMLRQAGPKTGHSPLFSLPSASRFAM
jgi:hypothetical protein